MESIEKHGTIQGRYPQCGAIFMSSSSTKDECFRRRLFGLPSKQGPFVKQVKRGMILFLFEFEKRELHGVFQACSDGTMNIDPTAWNRSGKKFPAQVKVNPIWRCHPLPESEFGDAIEANYFSNWKFNCGLSRAQVWRLLMLFNLRKLGRPRPHRALARNTVAQLVEIDGELDDGRFGDIRKVGNMCKVDNELRSIIRSKYLENSDFVQDCDDQNDIPFVRNEVNPLYTETNVLNQSLEDISMVDIRRSFSDINSTPFPGGVSSAEVGTAGRDGPSAYPLSPSNYPSFLIDGRHPLAAQDVESRSLSCHSFSADLESADSHKCKHSDHEMSDRMLCPDLQKSRSSVFSRLRSNNAGWCLKTLGHPGHEDTVEDTSPVDKSPCMESIRLKLCKRRQGNVEKSRNIKQRNSLKSEKELIPEKSITASLSPTVGKDDESSQNTLVLDFKRRSELRNVDSDSNGESARSEGLMARQCKRRKLIRPNFSKKECLAYPSNSCRNDESSFVGSQAKLSLQGAESSGDNEKFNTKCSSNHERENVEGSFGGSQKIRDDSGKACLDAYPVNSCLNLQASVDESSFCEETDCNKKLVEDVCNHVHAGMMNCQHESPQQEGSRNNVQEAVHFGGTDTSHENLREGKIDDKPESFVDSVNNGDEYKIESVQVVGTIILGALEDSVLTRLSEHFPETDQITVAEPATQLKTDSGTSSVIEGDRCREQELLPMAELCPNIIASSCADQNIVRDQHGVNFEQLEASCNSSNHGSHQERSMDNVVENMEVGDNEAIDDAVRENQRLWITLMARLKNLRNREQQ